MATLKKGLLLLGSFSIACTAAETLHELGHAAAAWATGGEVFAAARGGEAAQSPQKTAPDDCPL